MKHFRLLILFFALAIAAYGVAVNIKAMAENPQDHMGMEQAKADPMSQMAHAMNQPATGDADADFIRSMIPHHQGAVDMARDVLNNGDDAEVRALAEAIIKAQNEEIAWMRGWLARHNMPETGEVSKDHH